MLLSIPCIRLTVARQAFRAAQPTAQDVDEHVDDDDVCNGDADH